MDSVRMLFAIASLFDSQLVIDSIPHVFSAEHDATQLNLSTFTPEPFQRSTAFCDSNGEQVN